MAKTKNTPRKRLCNTCQKVFPSQEDFEYHVKVCVLSAVWCSQCKKTFGTKKYYLQHLRRVHMNPTGTVTPKKAAMMLDSADKQGKVVTDLCGAKEKMIEASTNKSESDVESEWDYEPDVEVGEDSDSDKGSMAQMIDSSSKGEEDTVSNQDNVRQDSDSDGEVEMVDHFGETEGESFLMGRIFRKQTLPLKVTPALKNKVPEGSQEKSTTGSRFTEYLVEDASRGNPLDPAHENNRKVKDSGQAHVHTIEPDHRSEQRPEDVSNIRNKRRHIRVTYARNTDDNRTRQSVLVDDDGERCFKSVMGCAKGKRMAPCFFNLGDYVGAGTVRLSDINVNVSSDGVMCIGIDVGQSE